MSGYESWLADSDSTDLAGAAWDISSHLLAVLDAGESRLRLAGRIVLNCLDEDTPIHSHKHLLYMNGDKLLWWALQRISEAAVRVGPANQARLASAHAYLRAHYEKTHPQPTPEWRRLVDEHAATLARVPMSADRRVLSRLALTMDPLDRSGLTGALADIVAICESVTGEAVDPEACEYAAHGGLAAIWIAVDARGIDWHRMGDYCAHWLRYVTEGQS